ncbi:MAG TPA: NAD(P)/FAD-dependent oxidoreductase [bacterium (Candidatus Stahlbacteria)]|nr:NAD(P)/FAD-dependent oxidoreductase [Candidatus Stahlbacteria bacterium]
MERQIIVGASSAGLYTGLRLARHGIPVRIIERRADDSPEPRLLIVTPELLRFVRIPDHIILNRIRSYELNSLNEKVAIDLAHPDLVFDRRDFLLHLENEAEKSGVEILRSLTFKGILKEGQRWYAECLDDGKERYFPFRRIIGADGARSQIARCFDAKIDPLYLIQAYVPLEDSHNYDTVRIWFDKRFTDYFVWMIPDGRGKVVLGLIAEDEEKAFLKLRDFLKEHNLAPISFESGPTSCYRSGFYPRVGLNGATAYLIGDAGGQVKMTTVGGTFAGLWSGYAVSEAIIMSEDFREYFRPLRCELEIHNLFRSLLKRLSNRDFDLLLRMSKGGLRRLLYFFSRDQVREIVRHILPANPLLSLLGLRCLIRSVRRMVVFKG